MSHVTRIKARCQNCTWSSSSSTARTVPPTQVEAIDHVDQNPEHKVEFSGEVTGAK